MSKLVSKQTEKEQLHQVAHAKHRRRYSLERVVMLLEISILAPRDDVFSKNTFVKVTLDTQMARVLITSWASNTTEKADCISSQYLQT